MYSPDWRSPLRAPPLDGRWAPVGPQPARWLERDLVEKILAVVLGAVPPLSKEVCELDGVLAKGRWISVHLANALEETKFRCHSAMLLSATNPISFWNTDPKHPVKNLGVLMFFAKVRAHIPRELLNNTEHGP